MAMKARMASKRSTPTDLFWDAAFSEFDGDTQTIFIGLILGTNDYGRGAVALAVLAQTGKDPGSYWYGSPGTPC
jgi:hypothetical protein